MAHDVAALTIGAGRAARRGWLAVGLVLLGAFQVVSSLLWGYSLIVAGCFWIVSGAVTAGREFVNRIDADETGMTGCRDRAVDRVRVTWADVADLSVIGRGTLRRPAQITAGLNSGNRVRLMSYGIDIDAAEAALESLLAFREQHDPRSRSTTPTSAPTLEP